MIVGISAYTQQLIEEKTPLLPQYFWYSGELSLPRWMKGFVKVTDMQ